MTSDRPVKAIFSTQMEALEKIMSFLRIDRAQDFAKDLMKKGESKLGF